MKLLATSLMAAMLVLPAMSSFAAGEGAPTGAPVGAAQPNPAPAPAPAVVTPVVATKPDLVKGEATYAAVCAACHGADANSGTPGYPKLAQQHPEYLVKQLQEYKEGKRKNAIMQGFAATLSPQDMKNIAYWATSKEAKAGFATEKELVSLGERIYRGGIADRQVAACAGCHTPSGVGIPAQYPRLKGQHAEYTATQLTYFRDGIRTNNLQMTQVAAKLNDKEIRAVADYIAGLR